MYCITGTNLDTRSCALALCSIFIVYLRSGCFGLACDGDSEGEGEGEGESDDDADPDDVGDGEEYMHVDCLGLCWSL